jgi:protein involved in polysaccharide export with SLBB domain
MPRNVSAIEFEAVIDPEGRIAVPMVAAQQLLGKKLHVRLMSSEISAALNARGVTEDEVERIAAVQRESREQVIKFLMSEGSLTTSRAFRRRAHLARGARKGTRR